MAFFRDFRRLAACAALALWVSPAFAEESTPITGVVELFTSQGCNSCPPADKVLAELGRRPDLLTLAYHVDYWNYLGWQDTLSQPESTERQRLYMRALRNRSIYTPQAVVNGRAQLNGANREGLIRALKEMSLAGAGTSVPLSVSWAGDTIRIEAGAAAEGAAGSARKAHLLLVSFGAPRSVAIRTGENQGHTITYWNPVANIQSAGMWRGERVGFELPASAIEDGKGAVALLQEVDADGLPGPIVGAALVRPAGGN